MNTWIERGIASALGAAVSSGIYILVEADRPADPSACEDSVELLGVTANEITCDRGARIATRVVKLDDEDRIEVVCRCNADELRDAGPPDASE